MKAIKTMINNRYFLFIVIPFTAGSEVYIFSTYYISALVLSYLFIDLIYILYKRRKEGVLPQVFTDTGKRECSHNSKNKFALFYHEGYIKICLFGGTAFKKKMPAEEVDPIIYTIHSQNMNEQQVIEYLTELGGFEDWDYYIDNEIFK